MALLFFRDCSIIYLSSTFVPTSTFVLILGHSIEEFMVTLSTTAYAVSELGEESVRCIGPGLIFLLCFSSYDYALK